MISPERLRQFPFFGLLNEGQLTEISMISKEESFEGGEVMFRESEPASTLYFLFEGSIDLYYTIAGIKNLASKGISVGEINPGEPFGISALIEPYLLTATAYVSKPSQVLAIDALALRALFKKDHKLARIITHQAAKAAIERLHATRVQLAAAWG